MEDAVKYFYSYVKKIFHSIHDKQPGGRDEAQLGFFFFFKKKTLKLFLVCVPCVQHHDGALQSEQSFLLETIQNGALLSLPGHTWSHASFY